MTSVSQLVNELRVSKVSIYALLKKEPLAAHVFLGDGKRKEVIMIDDTGVDMVRSYYANKLKGGPPSNPGTYESDKTVALTVVDANNVIRVLQQQLIKKDEQIESLLGIVSGRQEVNA